MVISQSHTIQMIRSWFLGLPRAHKRVLMLSADGLFIPLALWSALILESGWSSLTPIHLVDGLIALAVAVPTFTRMGLYRAVIRYIGSRAIQSILIGVSISVVILAILKWLLPSTALSFDVLVVYWSLAIIYVTSSRFFARSFLQRHRRLSAERVIIYGAGSAGVGLVWSMQRLGRYYPVGFVDDEPALQGVTVAGLEVDSPKQLPSLIRNKGVSAVLIALPSTSRRRRREIIESLEPLGVRLQIVPDVVDIVAGQASVVDLRDVDANDLLGRDPVPPHDGLLANCIRNKVVMVSGAGGSIGSELCRQIVRLNPVRLVLFEMSEAALYQIDKELTLLIDHLKLDVEVLPLLGNAHHRSRIKEVMSTYGVQTVYHAAAYKHVPMVEHNVVEGMHNNVFSTWYAAEAAIEANVEVFVLISTDKAVNPTNVMGTTKRMAEIVLQGLQQRGTQTRFCMVRFGNVLESSGSVVPLFREQIQRGGPVTVTHPDIVRYFMTIPEASQLVIQAGSMAKGGDVFVLNMGEPVRIYDLAVRMIHLMGCSVRDDKHPDGDIEIKVTGLRPAEKLYEELLIGNNVTGTEHPKIWRATEHSLPWQVVSTLLHQLLEATNTFDCERVRVLLMQAVQEYHPENAIQDLVWVQKRVSNSSSSNVTDLNARRIRL